MKLKFFVISCMMVFSTLSLSCNKGKKYVDYNFQYWNECTSLNNLKNYVKAAVDEGNENYIPLDDRVVTFDMDGTLYSERSPIYIEWLFYKDYYDNKYQGDKVTPFDYEYIDGTIRSVSLKGVYNDITEFEKGTENKFLENDVAACCAKLFSGLSLAEYQNELVKFLNKDAPLFNNITFKDMFYKPMKEIVTYLQQNNFNLYIVSGTDRFLVRTLSCEHLNISVSNVIGSDVSFNVIDGQIYRGDKCIYKNVKNVKPILIEKEISKVPVLSFGNSSGDIPMHDWTLANSKYETLAFMNVADDTERERGYTEEQLIERTKNWGKYQLFSMKNDWKTIYGDNVTLKK